MYRASKHDYILLYPETLLPIAQFTASNDKRGSIMLKFALFPKLIRGDIC